MLGFLVLVFMVGCANWLFMYVLLYVVEANVVVRCSCNPFVF